MELKNNLGRFVKGVVPWNKGMKGLHIEGSEKGWFKKGHQWSEEIQNKLLNNLRGKTLLKLNLEMNENLAYIVGLLRGDGWVSKKEKYYRFEFYTTEGILASNSFKAFKKLGLNPSIKKFRPSSTLSKKVLYKTIANSKIFCEWYNQLTIERLKLLLNTKEKIIGFLKGFYEAEGSICFSNDKLHVYVCNTNFELIKLVCGLLKKLGLNFNINGPYNDKLGSKQSKPIYRIITASRKNVLNFLNLISPSVKNISTII